MAKICCSLKGVKLYAWKKNLRGFFTLDGKSLTDAEARKLVLYGIAHNYETERDIPYDEAIECLGWNKTDNKVKIHEPMLF